MDRRLATIMAADIVGYSAHMQEDELGTIRKARLLERLLTEAAEEHGGRIFNRAGDGYFIEFSSPVAAVRCAFELQLKLASPAEKKTIGLQLRIGLHLADVAVDGTDMIGDGVNIASRIQSDADPGAVLVSRAVFEYAKRAAQLRFQSKGERRFKNIQEPIEVFAIVGELGTTSCSTAIIEDDRLPRTDTRGAKLANSIVVVPFKNLSADPDQEYFADGLSEDLITELSRFPDVMTISRNASFALKGITAEASELGKSLGAKFCLEGGIRRLGDRVRINAYLTDTTNSEQVWAERADCKLEELFDVQDDFVAKVVSCVVGQIERKVEQSARRKRPSDLEAYECLIRGLSYHRLGGVTKENAETALKWFDKALERDPSFGRAHAWRACAIATVAEWTGEDVWDELVSAGRRALELDETDAESHRIAGSLAFYQSDFDRAKYHFDRALELNPSHAFLVGRMGELHNFLGDGRTALAYQQRAKRLDPFLPEYCRELEAVAYYVLEDYDACIRVVGEFTRLTRRAAAYRVASAAQSGDDSQIGFAVRELLTLDPNFDSAQFIQTEYFKDRTIADLLKSRLDGAMEKRW